jgi:hypothetical protein
VHLSEQTADVGQIGFDLADTPNAELAALAVERRLGLARRGAWAGRELPRLAQKRRLAELLPPLGRQALALHPVQTPN